MSGGRIFHRIDFDFIGSNQNCEIITSESSSDYLNYYTTGTSVEGVTFVRLYKSITYKNIYPNIDLIFMMNDKEGFKYNFIVHPCGNLSSIRLKINGPEIILTESGSLQLTTTIGSIEEVIPQSWLLGNEPRVNFKTKFRLINDSLYGFHARLKRPVNSTLVIDPVPKMNGVKPEHMTPEAIFSS